MSGLVAEGVACSRGDRPVFAGVSFSLDAGGALVLTGRNGAGKSSLLRLLATLLSPIAGRLLWGGAPVAADLAAYRARLHYVGHLDAIKPVLTVRETLRFWAAMRAGPPAGADAALAAFGLERLADWPCRWLSAGQRKRLALARALAAPAPLWLLDEPTAALDADGEARLLGAIEAHRQTGGSIVVATHQPLVLGAAARLALDDFAARPAAPATDF